MKRKKVAIVLAFLMIVFFAFSVFFIAHEADHECIGEECPICEQIVICEKTLEELGSGIIAITIIIATVFGGVYKLLCFDENRAKKDSLVSLKIEMLN